MNLAMSYKPLYVAYLVYFNRDRDYFECHEVLEELWLAENYDLRYKGLLQIAVALFHVRNDNIRGGIKMFKSALSYLAPYPKELLGINLDKLKREVADYISMLSIPNVTDFYDLTIDIIDSTLAAEVARASIELPPHLPLRTTYKHNRKSE